MIQERTHNFSLHFHLIDTTTQLSYISISPLAAFKMLLTLLLHHYRNSHQVGNHLLPVSVCNFKVIVFDVVYKCQAALREAGESSAQRKTSNTRL